eukprot:2548211-Alexandrium_andersonii.AAC.1
MTGVEAQPVGLRPLIQLSVTVTVTYEPEATAAISAFQKRHENGDFEVATRWALVEMDRTDGRGKELCRPP